ncbi:hypothetical protein A9995_14005 [Erythrobacter sp. QSSC1-22B]|uniref:ImuA family protein n=1 Tax=Erythrobacter sp. QSSC1-22B TaxID=1860125 RepID=UPI000804AA40|nr:hypothetical protein [Erythrobacter sp. QSSC1-22B]OBX17910.1 hypothetical protein A9995_14005 [Erythrobacter sp. QSSC1-22B]
MKTEIFCSADDASGGGFAMALARRHGAGRPWLWVQDERSRKRCGVPYFHGMPEALRHECHYVAAGKVEDVLFALEEGLRCPALGFVIGEIAGDPKALGFTQSRRLAVASEQHGVPLYLLRSDAARSLSAARMRWQIEAETSQAPSTNSKAPGAPAWGAELFRSRLYQPSRWTLVHDRDRLSNAAPGDRVDLATVSGDRSLGASSNV